MGTPKPSIQWYKDDVEIFACERIEMREEDEGGAVILKESRLSDSGVIKCVASNILGRCTSTAQFTIEGRYLILNTTGCSFAIDIFHDSVKIVLFRPNCPKLGSFDN